MHSSNQKNSYPAVGYHFTCPRAAGVGRSGEAQYYPASSRETKGTKTEVAVGEADWQEVDYNPFTFTAPILDFIFQVQRYPKKTILNKENPTKPY